MVPVPVIVIVIIMFNHVVNTTTCLNDHTSEQHLGVPFWTAAETL